MKRDLVLFLRLLKLAMPFAGWMALAALLGFATVGSGIGLMATAAWLIASAALHPSIADLQVAIVGVRFFGIARAVFRYLERYVSHHVTFRLLARLRVELYRRIEPLAPAGLTQQHSGDLLTRAVADVDTLQNLFGRVIAPPAVAVLTVVAVWIFARGFDANLANVWVAFLVAAGLGIPALTRYLSRGPGERLVATRANLYASLVEGIQGSADLLAYGGEGVWLQRVRELGRDVNHLQARMAWITGLDTALGTLLTGYAALAVLLVAIPLVNAGRLDGIYLAVLALAAVASFEAVLPLAAAAQHLESSLRAAQRLFEWQSSRGQPHGISSEDSLAQRPAPVETGRSAITVDRLSFRYDPGAPLALDALSFDLPVGGALAIVGASGAGKSTLVNLLLRFWDYSDGSIALFGRELRVISPEEARGLIGVVAQNTWLFNGTIRENLLIARPDAGTADLDRATRQAQLYDFIQSLPHGYETLVGEQGLLLSGGERQRVALARALLKDAPILVLDEATANVDALTERAIWDAVQARVPGRSTLMITHRLAGLETADEILVLDRGRVLERGPHAELVESNGLYRQMLRMQAEWLDGE